MQREEDSTLTSVIDLCFEKARSDLLAHRGGINDFTGEKRRALLQSRYATVSGSIFDADLSRQGL